jgi:hypothetical protein
MIDSVSPCGCIHIPRNPRSILVLHDVRRARRPCSCRLRGSAINLGIAHPAAMRWQYGLAPRRVSLAARSLFPGYCFVRIELRWHAARWCHGAILVGDGSALADQSLPDPVQRLQVELISSLCCDELHGGSLNRLSNGLRIAEVVLLAFRQGRFLLPMRPSPYRSRVF